MGHSDTQVKPAAMSALSSEFSWQPGYTQQLLFLPLISLVALSWTKRWVAQLWYEIFSAERRYRRQLQWFGILLGFYLGTKILLVVSWEAGDWLRQNVSISEEIKLKKVDMSNHQNHFPAEKIHEEQTELPSLPDYFELIEPIQHYCLDGHSAENCR